MSNASSIVEIQEWHQRRLLEDKELAARRQALAREEAERKAQEAARR